MHQPMQELARAAMERGDYNTAMTHLRQLLRDHPDYADLRQMAGVCLTFLRRPEAALDEFDRAIALNPNYVEAHLNRALTLNDLGRFDEGREAFQRAAQVESSETQGRFISAAAARLANAHATVGDLYRVSGAFDEAISEYRKALDLRGRFHDIRNKLGCVLLEVDRFDEALEQFTQILEANPSYLDARLNAGLAHYRAGRPDDAAAEWRRGAEIAPDHPQVRAYLALLGKGQ